MASAKNRSRLLWGLSILLALLFLSSGASKLLNATAASGLAYSQQFVAWGYPSWARFIVGTLEVAGALGLLVPRGPIRFLAASGLTMLMLGAVATHLHSDEYAYALVPLVLGALAAVLAWARRPAGMSLTASQPIPE